MTPAELSQWLTKLHSEVQRTNCQFPRNLVRGWPIPFFGDLINAQVLTVGVNPSGYEFNPNRRWDEVTNLAQWQSRLVGYFQNTEVPAWMWFETWAICLKLIDRGYAQGAAAHVDISPRPTSPMLAHTTDKAEFRRMVQHDAKWFFELLSRLPQLQLLLVAGPIPRADGTKQQLAEFIREQAGTHGAEWREGEPLPRLVTKSHPKGIPVCVCQFERELDGRYSMIRQVYQRLPVLQGLARLPPHLTPILPARMDWPSAIGSFLLNFGMLEYLVFVYLKDHLPSPEFEKVKEWHLKDRLARTGQYLKDAKFPAAQQARFARLLEKLEPMRELRNQIAHGRMHLRYDPGTETATVTLLHAKEVDTSLLPQTQHLKFPELLTALEALGNLNEEFEHLNGFKPQ